MNGGAPNAQVKLPIQTLVHTLTRSSHIGCRHGPPLRPPCVCNHRSNSHTFRALDLTPRLCGSYYDEVTTDFGSADSDRIEYLKSAPPSSHSPVDCPPHASGQLCKPKPPTLQPAITMEQHADLQRTVKTMGTNGLESFTTIHLETLHFESHMMSTNCGPLGIKSDVEPGTNRAALSDRSVAHVVHAADDAGQNKSDGEFSLESASDNVREQVNRLRVVSCLMAYVLVFIKHLPHCQPNITYARELTNKWDDIQNDEFNLPRPSRRKKLKRKMMFNVFATESAIVEKFLWKHTAVDFKDMLPDANGNLSGFCIDQLVDVIRSLQRCLDHETILNAWSHNLDHSPPTTSHVFQMKTVLSQLHGMRSSFHSNPSPFSCPAHCTHSHTHTFTHTQAPTWTFARYAARCPRRPRTRAAALAGAPHHRRRRVGRTRASLRPSPTTMATNPRRLQSEPRRPRPLAAAEARPGTGPKPTMPSRLR